MSSERDDQPRSTGPLQEVLELPSEVAGTGEHRKAVREAFSELLWELRQINVQTGQFLGLGAGGDAQTIRVPPEGIIDIETQSWTLDNPRPLSSSIQNNTFTSDLANGEDATIADATSTDPAVVMDIMEVGSTLHEADVDGDGNSDESIIRYHYEYQRSPGGEWKETGMSPTVWPRGSLANPVAVFPGTVIGPVYGFRIRYENLTDEINLDPFSVSADEIRSVIKGRAYNVNQIEGVEAPG